MTETEDNLTSSECLSLYYECEANKCSVGRVDMRVQPVETEQEGEYTGGSSDYYKVWVKNPTTLPEPYMAECNDIIESLEMTFAEANVFKAIWRKCAARQGVVKKGYDNGIYDAEKCVFFSNRILITDKEKE